MKNILITGIDGFIGQSLAKKLAESGYSIYGLDKKGKISEEIFPLLKEYYPCDLTSEKLKNHVGKDIDVIIHLAGTANTSAKNSELAENNIGSTENILNFILNNGISKLVYMSSIKATQENNAYGDSKKRSEEQIKIKLENNTPYIILRPAVVYGVGMKSNLIRWFEYMKTGFLPKLPKSDYSIYMIGVTDLCRIIQACLETPIYDNKTMIVTDGQRYKISEIETKVRAYLGVKNNFYFPKFSLHIVGMLGSILNTIGIKTVVNRNNLKKYLDGSIPENDIFDPAGFVTLKENFYDQLPAILEYLKSE